MAIENYRTIVSVSWRQSSGSELRTDNETHEDHVDRRSLLEYFVTTRVSVLHFLENINERLLNQLLKFVPDFGEVVRALNSLACEVFRIE